MLDTIQVLLHFLLLCIAVMYLLTRSRTVVSLLLEANKRTISILFCILTFSLAIILTSKYGLPVLDVKTNLRTSVGFLAAIVGGPISGVIVNSSGAIFRLSLGGWTAIPCAAATLAGGIIASFLVWRWKLYPGKLTWKTIFIWTALVLVWDSIHVLFFIPAFGGQPFREAFMLMLNDVYLPQIIANTITMLVLSFLVMNLVTQDNRVIAEEQAKWINKMEILTHSLGVKVQERTKELEDTNKKLYESSILDPLTSLYNRQYLYHRLNEENSRISNNGEYELYSVLCIDLDNFKTYNDTYGHSAGDILLREFAQSLVSIVGNQGTLFRTGGDEFIIILPNIGNDEAIILAKSIIATMGKNNPSLQRIEEQQLSCSIGIKTTLNGEKEEETLDMVIYLADQALLLAKNKGKNQYILA